MLNSLRMKRLFAAILIHQLWRFDTQPAFRGKCYAGGPCDGFSSRRSLAILVTGPSHGLSPGFGQAGLGVEGT
jgi:hypothetical protein